MRIIQITDIHVDKVGELTNDINTQLNFLQVLDRAILYKPDAIVLTGDLCNQYGIIEIYEWFKSRLDILQIPYFVIPGNHDDAGMIASVFGYELIDGELYYSYNKHSNKLIFLDSGKSVMSEKQFDWLTEEINENCAVFMHHPPCLTGITYMDDNYKFQQIERFQSLINQQLAVFCGHFHCERTIQIGPMTVYITPSCYVQIDDNAAVFKPDHYNPAFRFIEIDTHGQIQTAVKYII